MDNSGTSSSDPIAAGPKVIDLSSINSVNDNPGGGNFFKKKPFIIGVLSVLLLAIIAGTGLYIVNTGQKPGPQPKAGECKDVQLNVSSRSPDTGDTAYLVGQAKNNCSTPVTIYKFKFWCLGLGLPCSGHESVEQTTIAPGESASFDVRQTIGNTKKCGSAQVDVMFTRKYDPNSGFPQEGVYSTLGKACETHMVCTSNNTCKSEDGSGSNECSSDSDCVTTKDLRCKSVTADSTTVTPGKKIHLVASSRGGTGAVTFKWSIDSAGVGKGTLSSTSEPAVDWTAPATLTANQSWTFTATAKDGAGKTDSSGCTAVASFTIGVQTYSHNVCNSSKACISQPCSPTTTDCSASTDCTSAADCETTTYRFNTCENESCLSKECPDPSQPCAKDTDCSNDNDCKSTPTHKVCQSNSCVTVDGSGSDSCTSDASCQPAATPPPVPESGNTALTIAAIAAGFIAILGGIFLAL